MNTVLFAFLSNLKSKASSDSKASSGNTSVSANNDTTDTYDLNPSNLFNSKSLISSCFNDQILSRNHYLSTRKSISEEKRSTLNPLEMDRLSPDDSDDGVATVAFSDSEWERLSYEGQDLEAMLNDGGEDVERGMLDGGDEDEEEDGIETINEAYDSLQEIMNPLTSTTNTNPPDEDDTSFLTTELTENCDSGYTEDGCVDADASPGVILLYLGILYDWLMQRITSHRLYRRFLEDNAMLSSCVLTTFLIMALPAVVSVFVALGLLACSAVACVIVGAIIIAVGVVVSIVWSLWVSIPLFIMVGSLAAGNTLYRKFFKTKLSAKDL